MIPYAKPDVDEQDIQAVVDVLKTDWLTQGPAQERFEQAVANYCGVKYAVTMANATGGLHLAYLALGLGAGDEVWTSPNTFVATANAAYYAGGRADFVDIDPRTYNLSTERLAEKLAQAKRGGQSPKIISPVHFAGQSCAMKEIATLARAEGIAVVEDAAHGIGGSYAGKPVGCCEWSDAAVFSFHAVKIITTGEGGMVLTNRLDLYEKLIRLRSHGITRDPRFLRHPSEGPWYYEQIELGYHYRMTDIQAALGASQMRRIDSLVGRRREIVRLYNQQLADLPLVLPWQDPETDPSWHLYVVQLKLDEIKKTHRQIFEQFRAAGLGVNLHYIPVYLQPFYRDSGFNPGYCPQAEDYYHRAVTLPLYPKMNEGEIAQVIEKTRSVLLA